MSTFTQRLNNTESFIQILWSCNNSEESQNELWMSDWRRIFTAIITFFERFQIENDVSYIWIITRYIYSMKKKKCFHLPNILKSTNTVLDLFYCVSTAIPIMILWFNGKLKCVNYPDYRWMAFDLSVFQVSLIILLCIHDIDIYTTKLIRIKFSIAFEKMDVLTLSNVHIIFLNFEWSALFPSKYWKRSLSFLF